jgi:hypothetical protein
MPRHSPPSQGIAPEHIYGQNAINDFHPTTNFPHFSDPFSAVQAMNSGSRQTESPPHHHHHHNHFEWEAEVYLNPTAKADAALDGDRTPDSVREFATGFLSDINAPSHLWAEAAIDPRLPVVPNEIYNPSKDLDYK